MAKGNKKKKQYSRKYFQKAFPPNHNPIIGTLHMDTIHNVHDAIALLQEIAVCAGDNEFLFSKWSNNGYFYLSDCILHTLRFEIYHREMK